MTKLARKSNIALLSEVLKDPDRKPIFRMITDFFSLLLYHKRFPKHYFSRYLFKKGKNNIKDYFTDDFLYYKIKPLLNDAAVIDVVENKLFFDFYYRQFNISLPLILMYNYKKLFVFGNASVQINNVQDFRIQLESIFRQNTSYNSIFIKRTYGSYGGDEVYRLTRSELTTNTQRVFELYTKVIQTGFLFQETISQHPELDKLNPSCLSTIRFDTFIDKEGNIEIISGYLRMSVNNSHIDNISSGGCMVGINLDNGRLKKNGYSNISTSGVKVVTIHPLTNVVFENFKVPLFVEAKELVLKAAACMPGLRIIGWDVALGELGPIIIEGNSDYNISGNDLCDSGYRANTTFRKVLHELNYL